MSKRIYVVEDEQDMLDYFQFILTEENYEMKGFTSGEALLKEIKAQKPDLILLDLMLPGISGFEVCRALKNDDELWNIPIIVISSRKDEFDIINGINFGCDDYITKPFNEKILLAKIKSILQKEERQSREKYNKVKFKDLVINSTTFEATINGKDLDLTPTEFKLLDFFLRNREKVFSREELSDIIYDYDNYNYFNGDRSIDILITRIRKKIGDYSKNIKSIYGVGYRFKEDV
ncbi:MAG: response regulator transcription factor [Candidatus Gastranaerophilales bacterium]|nr:response regulator transcription factor [Candidatus Gastranaerophilales bacterium]